MYWFRAKEVLAAWKRLKHKSLLVKLALIGMLVLGAACSAATVLNGSSASREQTEIVVYGWAGYIPDALLESFTQETGIGVVYETYESYEEAIDRLHAGVVMDVLVLGTERVDTLLDKGMLAALDYGNVPNFRYVSPSFRDLAFDPNNVHSVPFQWGAPGLIVRTDLVERPITRWADLWDPTLAGRVAVWPLERDLIGFALKSLGYSINTEDAGELDEAAELMAQLAEQVILIDPNLPHAGDLLASGEVAMIYGWAYDYHEALSHMDEVAFVLPEEGAIIWMEHLVIPAVSEQKAAAELFINYLLEPENAALMVNEIYVAVPNDAALPFINAEIRNDLSIFPTQAQLAGGEFLLPVSEETQARYSNMYETFLAHYE